MIGEPPESPPRPPISALQALPATQVPVHGAGRSRRPRRIGSGSGPFVGRSIVEASGGRLGAEALLPRRPHDRRRSPPKDLGDAAASRRRAAWPSWSTAQRS